MGKFALWGSYLHSMLCGNSFPFQSFTDPNSIQFVEYYCPFRSVVCDRRVTTEGFLLNWI